MLHITYSRLALRPDEHGEDGVSFSLCEVFTDAPEGLAGPEQFIAAWHFRIVDKQASVAEGEIGDADLSVRVVYAQVLPLARMVYTPEMAQKARAARAEAGGDDTPRPAYLLELHNRLAVVTR